MQSTRIAGSAKTTTSDPIRVLAIDVGAGTQDVLVYESDRQPENCIKFVLPSQTQVVATRIRRVTEQRAPLHLTGSVMGGGASSDAVSAHLGAGLPVSATETAARTLHNDLERVRRLGVSITEEAPPGAMVVRLADVDLDAIEGTLGAFEVPRPPLVAVAVQDHGYLPGAGGREFRYEFLQELLAQGGDVLNMVFRDPPAYMLRMRAVQETVPGALVMDTGAAAVLGILGDRRVAEAAAHRGAILVNIGNMHTFAVALRGTRIYGLFEHHTGGITPEALSHLVGRLQAGALTNAEVQAHGGHGAAFDPAYGEIDPIHFVAITGPNRALARGIGYYEAVPHGDMMLSGPFGLTEGTLRLLDREGWRHGLSLVATS